MTWETLMVFRPRSGSKWHGVGQDPEGIADYIQHLPNDLRPAIVSAYTAAHPDWTCFAQWRGYSRSELYDQFEQYPACIHHLAIPMCVSRLDEQSRPWVFTDLIASGSLDSQLRALAKRLGDLKHPVLCRPGFEFNGDWNGYEPTSFVRAYRRVVDVMRDASGNWISWVWHGVTHTPGLPDWMRWYPGDDVVDWVALSTFRRGHFGDSKGGPWVRDAERLGKPFMICESTPMLFDIVSQPEDAWSEWYAHLFDFVRRHDACEAFVYINQDLTKFPMWKDFGDSRLHRSPALTHRYIEALKALPLSVT